MAAQVIDIGKTPEGRTLHVVKLSSGGEQGEKDHPCILMYAREHADEHDSSWLVAGALKWLLADGDGAQDLRSKFTFMFIPILDMDLAAKSGHENVIRTFLPKHTTLVSILYGEFFENWMQKGNPIDIVFNFHNMESAEGENLVPPLFPPKESPWYAPTVALAGAVRQDEQSHGFSVHQGSWSNGFAPERLGGWLGGVYGALHVPLEANSQNPGRHLAVGETAAMGGHILGSACSYLSEKPPEDLRAMSAAVRQGRAERWSRLGSEVVTDNPFAAESRLLDVDRSSSLLNAVLK